MHVAASRGFSKPNNPVLFRCGAHESKETKENRMSNLSPTKKKLLEGDPEIKGKLIVFQNF